MLAQEGFAPSQIMPERIPSALLTVLVILAALLAVTGKDAGQWLLVLGGWLGVMVVELLNSADEESFDLVTTEWNEHVKRGKDMASAAIFLAMVINAGIWAYVFLLN